MGPSTLTDQREKNVAAGLTALDQWLRDLIRRGLATVENAPPDTWEKIAARLVDAQAPGLAQRVRALAQLPYTHQNWPELMLARLGQIHLLVQGYQNLDTLSPDTQADIRTQIGWTQNQEALLNQPGQADVWLVLGRRISSENRLHTQRTWLWGKARQEAVLVLDFAHGSDPLATNLMPGTCFKGELVFFPGSPPRRGLVKAQSGAPQPFKQLPGYKSIAAGIEVYATALTRNPWLAHFPLALQSVWPLSHQNRWLVRDESGHSLPLPAADDGWRLLALSSGAPISLFGEWSGRDFHPLSAWAEERFVSLQGLEVRRQWDVV